jgi:hypothetical protein
MMRWNSVRKRDLLAEIDGYSVSFLPRGETVRMTLGLALIPVLPRSSRMAPNRNARDPKSGHRPKGSGESGTGMPH